MANFFEGDSKRFISPEIAKAKGSRPEEYPAYFEDLRTQADKEFGRKGML